MTHNTVTTFTQTAYSKCRTEQHHVYGTALTPHHFTPRETEQLPLSSLLLLPNLAHQELSLVLVDLLIIQHRQRGRGVQNHIVAVLSCLSIK